MKTDIKPNVHPLSILGILRGKVNMKITTLTKNLLKVHVHFDIKELNQQYDYR